MQNKKGHFNTSNVTIQLHCGDTFEVKINGFQYI